MNKLLICDLDGTLVNSIGGIADSVNKTRAGFGFPPLSDQEIMTYVGNGTKTLMERSCRDVSLPVSLDETVKIMTEHYANEPLSRTTLYPGVKECLQKLQQKNWIICIVSNKTYTVSDKIIEGLGINCFITENIGDGNSFPLKPAPDAIAYLMSKYDCRRNDTFVAGDNHTDIDAAANAGVRAVFCKYGFGTPSPVNKAFAEVDSFSEIYDILTSAQ